MTKNKAITIEEIKNFEEYSNELMKEITEGNVDWEIEDGKYINKKTRQIIAFSNFSSEQNKKLKERFSRYQIFRERGRMGKFSEEKWKTRIQKNIQVILRNKNNNCLVLIFN